MNLRPAADGSNRAASKSCSEKERGVGRGIASAKETFTNFSPTRSTVYRVCPARRHFRSQRLAGAWLSTELRFAVVRPGINSERTQTY